MWGREKRLKRLTRCRKYIPDDSNEKQVAVRTAEPEGDLRRKNLACLGSGSARRTRRLQITVAIASDRTPITNALRAPRRCGRLELRRWRLFDAKGDIRATSGSVEIAREFLEQADGADNGRRSKRNLAVPESHSDCDFSSLSRAKDAISIVARSHHAWPVTNISRRGVEFTSLARTDTSKHRCARVRLHSFEYHVENINIDRECSILSARFNDPNATQRGSFSRDNILPAIMHGVAISRRPSASRCSWHVAIARFSFAILHQRGVFTINDSDNRDR